MIITVAHLSDSAPDTSPLAHVMQRPDSADVGPQRVLLVRTADDARSGEQICHEAIERGSATVAAAVIPTAKAMHTVLPRLSDHYDDVVIQVQGVNTALMRTALALSDRVVVPVIASDNDPSVVTHLEQALREFMMTVAIARHHNAGLVAQVVPDQGTPEWLLDLVAEQEGWGVVSGQRPGSALLIA
jgi:hypothetical protein